MPGIWGIPRSSTRSIQKGTTPTQASPSKVSITSSVGMSGVNWSAGTGQCAKRRSFQRWLMAHGPVGGGQ